ncbi:Uma2 family endonuclease [Streptomyces triculaminicus]|uniref:Uma2 family endonuclease n=1 Tax=Streptomyces triculaminicus TaxID=2816232 RepID=UPI0033DD55B0
MGAAMAAEAWHEQPGRAARDEPATRDNWMYPPADGGWTWDQVRELVLPFDWELLGGKIVVRGAAKWWHNLVRDELYYRLRSVKPEAFAITSEQSVIFNDNNVPRPDIVVFDKRGLDVGKVECIPVEKVVLAIEVVSPGSRTEDRFLKPGMYAQAGIDYYWRIERGEGNVPEVHECWRHREAGFYVPSPDRPTHVDTFKTDVPFPIEIDLRDLIEV